MKPSLPFYRSNMKEAKGSFSVTCFIKRLLLVSRTDVFFVLFMFTLVWGKVWSNQHNHRMNWISRDTNIQTQSACQSVCCCGNQVLVATLIWPSENILNINRLQCCPSGLPIFFKSFCTWCLHVLKLCHVSWPVEPVSTCLHAPEGLEAFVDDKFSTWGIAVAL